MIRTILHVDMDAFYASVEERDRPELKGKPLIVGGTSGRGVVAAASYAVRRFGVHSAMPIAKALKLCPGAICVRPRMARYQEVSAEVFEIFRDFTPLIEGLSLDEAFLDVTACERLLGDGLAIAAEIRRRIRERIRLTASVGIAPNKLLAKIASDINKPDGLCRIDADNLRELLDPLPAAKLFGVGLKSLPAVVSAGLRTFGDIRRADARVLLRVFGKHGEAMRDRASGIDDRPVEAHRTEKSISAEETFAVDLKAFTELKRELVHLADRTASRLRASELAAGTVTLKIRRADFTTYTRQKALRPATQDTARVYLTAERLLEDWLKGQPDAAIRLLGIGAGNLRTMSQAELFTRGADTPGIPGTGTSSFGTAASRVAGSPLDAAVDGIRERFGNALVTRAGLLPRSEAIVAGGTVGGRALAGKAGAGRPPVARPRRL